MSEGLRPVAKKLKSFLAAIAGSAWSTFQLMRRNSALQNVFGIMPTVASAIMRLKIWMSFEGCPEIRCESCGDPKDFFGPAFMLLTYHGPKWIVPFIFRN
jgi:hypothetical protein